MRQLSLTGSGGTRHLKFVPPDNPIHQVRWDILQALLEAQASSFIEEFATAAELCARVFGDLRLALAIPAYLHDEPPTMLSDLYFSDLASTYRGFLVEQGVPQEALLNLTDALAQRTHLVRAFRDPETVVGRIVAKVTEIVSTFPCTAADMQCGRNPGDVLDPYILAATQYLLCVGSFEKAIAALVGHKALMIIEGLLGHLHEDVIGAMRGNIRAPEPRGDDQENLDLEGNPFPGSDIVQVPFVPEEALSFHQVKTKTGSAKGGDGNRLGRQLKLLQETYGGEIYYHALIGNTLVGHRSKTGVEKEAASVIVLVGDASFRCLTRTPIGPALLLRVYQAAFAEVQQTTGYDVETMTAAIVAVFQERAEKEGESFLDVVLSDAIDGPPELQDSRIFNTRARSRRRR
jgi:hypothetical protein